LIIPRSLLREFHSNLRNPSLSKKIFTLSAMFKPGSVVKVHRKSRSHMPHWYRLWSEIRHAASTIRRIGHSMERLIFLPQIDPQEVHIVTILVTGSDLINPRKALRLGNPFWWLDWNQASRLLSFLRH